MRPRGNSPSTLQLGASESHLAERIARLKSFDTPKQPDKEREDLIAVLNDALSGKTVLLQEVHHRVKNNLALITALLEMQAATLDDERAITALRESQQRVMSMALIHEYLYGNEHQDCGRRYRLAHAAGDSVRPDCE